MRSGLLNLELRILIVVLVFWLFFGYGWWADRLSARVALLFAGLFAAGVAGSTVFGVSAWIFVAWVAILNVALAFVIYYLNALPDEPTNNQ